MKQADKKEKERRIIEEARRRSPIFARGPLSSFESPDWLIVDAAVGIEVTDLLRPRGSNVFSGAQLASFQTEVVERARALYYDRTSADADVLVFFRNEWNRKYDVATYAEALAQMVLANRPADQDCITIRGHHVEGWIEGVSVIRIATTGSKWQAGGSADGYVLKRADLARLIAAKHKLVPQYRTNAPGFAMWLLIATDIKVLRSVELPREIEEWSFEFGFDKVLLMPWEGGLIELRPT
jgi:hypothetical protein